MNAGIEAFALFLANQHPTVIFVVAFSMLGSPLAMTVIVLYKQESLLGVYKNDTDRILKSYGEHIQQLSEYYERNVELVKSWQQIAEGFRDTVVLNTQTLTRVCDAVETNQFCPSVRVDKTLKRPRG